MAIYMKDKKSTYLLYNTMSSVIAGMTGTYTVIDLRNEASVRGKITSVDGYMNVEMEDCIFRNPRVVSGGQLHVKQKCQGIKRYALCAAICEFFPFSDFFISARNIRYVHVPDKCSAEDLIIAQQNMNKKVKNVSKKRTYKQKRAEMYQAELQRELSSNE